VEQMGTQAASTQSEATRHAGKAAKTTQTQASTAAGAAADTMYNPMMSMFSLWESAFREASAMATRGMSAAQSGFDRTTQTASGFAESMMHAAEDVTHTTAHAGRKAASEAADGSSSRKR
ncbi:MAG TPA: hypothetical protein VM406_04820, partial [Noviherbaspirillum sp.]|nr:hypothetical protein [Noviherbaspirillum sp.]